MAMDRGCPGQDRSSWTADDIFEVPCPNCGKEIEFFKDDARRYCRSVRHLRAEPQQDVGCAAWCSAAEKCSVGRQWIEDDSLKDPPAFDG